MSSNFDKAFNVASADQRASEELKAAEEREKQRNLNIARSLADPYLQDLGLRVVQKLRELKLRPERLVTQKRSFLSAEQAVCWWPFSNSPPYDTYSDVNRIKLLLLDSGIFYRSRDWTLSKGVPTHIGFLPIRPAVCQLEQALSMEWSDFSVGLGVFDETQTFVDPVSQVVYIVVSVRSDLTKSVIRDRISQGRWGPIMVLSAYAAHKIETKRLHLADSCRHAGA